MGVTAIKSIVNGVNAAISINNHENSRASASVLPHEPVRGCDIWIPWCTSEEDFRCQHYLEIEVRPPSGINGHWWIWQGKSSDGDFVRISTQGRFAPAQSPIAGYSRVVGNKDVRLLVSSAGLRLETI